MGKDLPIWIMEPEPSQKRVLTARKLTQAGQRKAPIPETVSTDDIKQHLRRIREYARDNMNSLVKKLETNLRQKYPQVQVKSTADHVDAVRYITEIADGINTISTNNSHIVNHELKPRLETNGFTVINSYFNEFESKGGKITEYWEHPYLLDKNLMGSFEITTKMAGIDQPDVDCIKVRKYLALLGVNAISAEDGTVFFLQHFSNISKDLKQAEKVVLVVGLDKIVKNDGEAAFQTKCMGIFGMESIALDIQLQLGEIAPATELAPLSDRNNRELHLIILDNNRTDLLQTEFKDLLLCISCQACNSPCPAHVSGKPLSPREIILNLKKHLLEIGSDFLKSESATDSSPISFKEIRGNGMITRDEIWACTTCNACQEACPVQIEHVDAIIGLRQNLVMERAIAPDTVKVALKCIETRGHPWRGTKLRRTDWSQGLDIQTLAEDGDIDILYWVGCTAALENRSMKVAQALGKLLKLAGIKVGILGTEESCCGEPARRLGNEYLFRIQAEKNIELLRTYGVKKIVTACPHCYHTLKNEYPQFGGDFKVNHHTQFVADLLAEDKLGTIKGNEIVVAYHDPCYLGRYNAIYEPPRQILKNMLGLILVEMEQNRQRSFCCGGGGGRMWLEESIGQRISEMRIQQAVETKSQVVVTACPFCLQMFIDATKAKGVDESLKVMDIAELVANLTMV